VSAHMNPQNQCEGVGAPLTCISHQFSSRGRKGVVRCGVCDQEARLGSPVPSADGSRESTSRREEEVDARASSTTSNAEIGHDPHRPEGLRRHGPVFFVAAPRRWKDIAVVTAPRIRTHGARNGRRWGPGPSLEGAERVLAVRRAPRWEQTPQIAADLRPQQKIGEICRLISIVRFALLGRMRQEIDGDDRRAGHAVSSPPRKCREECVLER